MEPLEILTMAQHAAQLIRTAGDRERALTSAYGVLEREPPMDQDESFAIRITRLMTEAGDRRSEVLDFLRSLATGLRNRPLSKNSNKPGEDPIEAEPEALRLLDYVEEAEERGRNVFPDGFGAFSLANRAMLATFGGRTVIERDGQRLSLEEAGQPEEGDRFHVEKEGLPSSVRGLIDYPLQVPVLFTIETGLVGSAS
jgi:hypothetical protein